jgi:hypothetical protein
MRHSGQPVDPTFSARADGLEGPGFGRNYEGGAVAYDGVRPDRGSDCGIFSPTLAGRAEVDGELRHFNAFADPCP